MEKRRNNCDEIKKASRKVTYKTLLPYKTPILHGAIQINNEYNKNVNDGIDYKNLCQDLHKYVNAQKKCVQDVTASQNRTFLTKEWKDIIKGLVQTYNAKNIKKICYYEGDNDTKKKKNVLNIHDVFRKFCIEKKLRFQNLGDMDFLQCNEYLSWIAEKKKELQSLDPDYKYIEEYKEYFHIHDNCNYPWLLKKTPDITCRMSTKTKAKEREGERKSLGDTSQVTPPVMKDSSTVDKKDTPPASQPSAKVDRGPVSVQTSDKGTENSPTRTTVTNDSNSSNNIVEPKIDNMLLVGFPISESHHIPKNIPDDKYLEYKSFLYHLYDDLYGQIIPHDVRQTNNIEPKNFLQKYPNYVHGEPITPITSKSNNYMPTKNLRKQRIHPVFLNNQPIVKFIPRLQQFPELIHNSQRYPSIIPPKKYYDPKYISMQTSVPFFRRINTIPKSTPDSRNNNMDIVKIQLPIPDPSLFRSPFLIFMLAFLILSTIITIFYLLSKYTTFGLLVGKKKKKNKLKRQLEIKKLPKEASHFDGVDIYSINDMQYESKTHDKNIYSHIKIQKRAINKNICSPKRKKINRKGIIDIHLELLNECKNDEWELNKDDFLEICLEQFTKEQNKTYADLENTGLIKKNILFKNPNAETTFLFHKWAKSYNPIWENFKRGNTFKLLQYHWKEEEKAYLDKIKAENNIFNENDKIPSIEIKKDIWRKWITKQATLIEQYKEEQWFKSLVEELENVSDVYKQGEIMGDIFQLNTEDLDHKENNEKLYKRNKHIYIIKVFIQILMMLIEECIKEKSPEKTELLLDNLIDNMNKEKGENIESENIYEENANHMEYNEMLEQDKPKNEDSFKHLTEV
ncbi:STP1 protein [Plasmodium ovale curtisi]|uniref:STP1 protein n=1 Tax=Plasmodium ovale curtisi TaxID=864141 RepID=A0A1A8WHV1_PLAOA|nr:STP1 protein [Plasmodium ovale curtisi]